MLTRTRIFAGVVLALAATGTVQADAILSDGNVVIGVNDTGQLNVSGGVSSVSGEYDVGVRYVDESGNQYEVTSHGCECEGWGVAADGISGYANDAAGSAGLTLDSFVSDATTATSIVHTSNLSVTHDFALSADTDNLYQVTVTITNTTDSTVSDVEYRRTMDWDADPTPFSELVTIGGAASATAVLEWSNDGFSNSNPLTSICGNFGESNCLMNVEFTDAGFPYSGDDHGANFDFGFGDLAAGESVIFSIFYGGADNVSDAFNTMAAAGVEVYSLGRSIYDLDGDGLNDSTGAITPTYIFGFAGVGGEVVVDPVGVPEPGTFALLGLGLLGFGFGRRRR